MTIGSTTNQVPYTGDGVSVAFAYPSSFITAADIKVSVAGVLITTGFTVTGTTDVTGNGAFVSGTVTFVTAPANGAAVILYCDPDQLQTSVLLPNDPLPAKTVEKMVDKVTLLIQRIRQTMSQSLNFPLGEAPSTLPPATARAGFLLGFDGAGAVALVSAVAQSATALALNLLSSAGATLVSYMPSWTGGVLRTLFSRLEDTATIRDANVSADGTTDDAAKLNAALSSGKKVILGLGLTCKINSSLTIPAGVELRDINLVHGTAGMTGVLYNTGSRMVRVKVTGTGTTNIVERGFYPAVDGASDVYVDIEVTNLTFGFQAQNIGAYIPANYPRRITGRIYAHDIVGAVGASEGYGLLLSPALDCDLVLAAKNIARHAWYFSAGAKSNFLRADVDTCSNYAGQMFSTAGQDPTILNTVWLKARNLTQNTGLGGALAIVQNAHRNTVYLSCEGNGATQFAATVQGSSGGPYPLRNEIICQGVTGQYLGSDVINLSNADSTVVTGSIDAYATFSCVATRTAGTNGSTHGGHLFDLRINAQGQNCIGVYSEVTTVPTYIGPSDIRNTGTALRVTDSTSGQRQGFTRRLTFSGTTASIASVNSGDTLVTLPDSLHLSNRYGVINLGSSSGTFFNSAFWTAIIGAPDQTHLNFRTYNGAGGAQTFTYSGWVEGD